MALKSIQRRWEGEKTQGPTAVQHNYRITSLYKVWKRYQSVGYMCRKLDKWRPNKSAHSNSGISNQCTDDHVDPTSLSPMYLHQTSWMDLSQWTVYY